MSVVTPETYNSAVSDIASGDTEDVQGIMVNSGFSALKSFHVCQLGLPSCLGYEGVLSYHVALYLKYFIKKKKWFTYTLVNQ